MKLFRLLPLLALSLLPMGAGAQDNIAEQISESILGPRHQVDYAFGAFQRGYFLTALALALPRAEQGDAAAQTLIAEIYAKGLGVRQNPERAAGWYQLAARNGDRLAIFELGMLYQEGVGIARSRERAAELFAQAAEAGYIPAKYNLALLHVEGIYAAPSLSTAAALMKEAADAELAEAQYDYGAMLLEGAGVLPDIAEGARYIGLAAMQGLAPAQVDYATLHYLGQGVERSVETAALWYERAAESGSAVAQNRYAKLLAVGEGVELDLEEAAMWRALARRQGLTDPALDRLLISISPQSLARAEERARFWPSTPPGSASAANAVPPEILGPVLPNSLDAENAPSMAGNTDQDEDAAPDAPAATGDEPDGNAQQDP